MSTGVARGKSIEWLRPRPIRTAATAPRWKCGASINLTLVDDGRLWNAEAAATSIYELTGMSIGPWADSFLARKGSLVYDLANPSLKSSYRFVFAMAASDGSLVAVREGLAHAEFALSACVELPTDVRTKAAAVVAHYRERMSA